MELGDEENRRDGEHERRGEGGDGLVGVPDRPRGETRHVSRLQSFGQLGREPEQAGARGPLHDAPPAGSLASWRLALRAGG